MRATIVIPTFNGEDTVGAALEACLTQQLDDGTYEVLVIDSGSTDGTVAIVSGHPSVRVHHIPNEEFGHGRTRNLGARLASGEVVAFLTQDAVPLDDQWLQRLVEPVLGGQAAATYGRQVPHERCVPIIKRNVHDAFAQLGNSEGVVAQYGARPFFSNVNSAVAKSALEAVPFRNVRYAEDQALAEDFRSAGLEIGYVPAAAVRHSHNYGLAEYVMRIFDETRGLMSLGRRPDIRIHYLVAVTIVGTLRDWAFTIRDPAWSWIEKARWIAVLPLFNLGRRVAIRLAARPRSPWLERRLSLEARRRAR